ncbi:MAG: phosphatidate cytidylyltransferase [Pseudomonadota bacterium]|nr:phosphatidate cytidylyltransferase [Pseudomonadota bacterium]
MIYAVTTPVLLAMLNDAADAPGKNPPAPNFSGRRGLADLVPRVVSATVLMAAALVSVWWGGLVFDLIWLGAALAVGCEWQHLIAAPNPRVRFLLVALGLVLSAHFVGKAWFGTACSILGCCGLALALAAGPGRRIWAFGGIVYAGLLLVSAGALHGSAEDGARSIVWLFATVWGTDVFAYFGGRLIGGAKLWPKVSPSKTWSGTLTGVLAGALLGAVTGVHGLSDPARALPIFALGLATAAVSQGGDIFESWVKRRFGAKDSSGLIPGHGGFMDRLDGFIAAAAFALLAGAARGGASIAAGLFDWF